MQMNRFLTLFLFSLLLLACSSKNPEEPTELMDKIEKEQREIALDTPENELLEDGKKYFNSELYSLAKQNFEALRTGYPNSSAVDFAEIKIADCMFESADYIEASKAYESFVRLRPTHPSASYMLYRAGRTAQLSFTGVGRDPAPLQRSLDLFNRLLKEYPSSPYEAAALENKKEILEDMVAAEKRIQHFYEKKSFDEAAKLREEAVEKNLSPQLKSIPALTNDQQKKDLEDVPDGIPLEQALKDLPRLVKIECNRIPMQNNFEKKQIWLVFNQEIHESVLAGLSASSAPTNGKVTLPLKEIILPNQQADCFTTGDLELTSAGMVTIITSQNIETTYTGQKVVLTLAIR
jgi:outer membrane assembly lipoprotein YfiO